MLGFDKSAFADLELGRRDAGFVGLNLVPFLSDCDIFAEMRVKLVEVDCKFARAIRCNVAFGVDGNRWVVAFVREKGGNPRSCVRCVVIREFREREQIGPVVLLIGAINADVLFEGLVGSFGLSIAFWMITRCEVKADVEQFSEGAEKVGNEF